MPVRGGMQLLPMQHALCSQEIGGAYSELCVSGRKLAGRSPWWTPSTASRTSSPRESTQRATLRVSRYAVILPTYFEFVLLIFRGQSSRRLDARCPCVLVFLEPALDGSCSVNR